MGDRVGEAEPWEHPNDLRPRQVLHVWHDDRVTAGSNVPWSASMAPRCEGHGF